MNVRRSNTEIAEINAFVNKKAREHFNQLLSQKPHLAGYKLSTKNYAYPKPKEGASKVPPMIVTLMLYKGGLEKTQDAILAQLREKMPGHNPSKSIWARLLRPKQIEKLQAVVNGNMVKPINVRDCKTLSQIRKKLRASAHKGKAKRTFKPSITANREAVTIGRSRSYPIEIVEKPNGSKYAFIRVTTADKKRHWLRLDVLFAFLEQK